MIPDSLFKKKRKNWMIDVLVPSKGWEWQSANLLAIL
jgi:hypothetical protein